MNGAGQKSMFKIVVALGLAAALSGCSYISDMFPDKQKVYRFSTDIPPLEIPPDLTSSTINGAPGGNTAALSSTDRLSAGAAAHSSAAEAPMPAKRTKAVVTTLAKGDDDVPFLDVEAPFAETWNFVGRALGRMQVEVTEQNRTGRQYFVYYGGSAGAGKGEDQGAWDTFKSILGADTPDPDEQSEQFHVKLEPKDDHTHIYVFDAANKPVSQGVGLRLLKKLQDTLDALDKQEFVDPSAIERSLGEAPTPRAGSVGRKQAVVSTLVHDSNNLTLVDIEAPFADSWNYVGRALSQMDVKVTDQNRSDRQFFVNYGGNVDAGQEPGAWSSLQAVLGGGSSADEETEQFRVRLEPKDDHTEVVILDNSNKPVTQGLGLKLIKQLQRNLDDLDKPTSKR